MTTRGAPPLYSAVGLALFGLNVFFRPVELLDGGTIGSGGKGTGVFWFRTSAPAHENVGRVARTNAFELLWFG